MNPNSSCRLTSSSSLVWHSHLIQPMRSYLNFYLESLWSLWLWQTQLDAFLFKFNVIPLWMLTACASLNGNWPLWISFASWLPSSVWGDNWYHWHAFSSMPLHWASGCHGRRRLEDALQRCAATLREGGVKPDESGLSPRRGVWHLAGEDRNEFRPCYSVKPKIGSTAK